MAEGSIQQSKVSVQRKTCVGVNETLEVALILL